MSMMTNLDIAETSGVDHPAHGVEGWVVIKSASETTANDLLATLTPEIPEVKISKEETPMPESEVVVTAPEVPTPVATVIAETAPAEAVIKSTEVPEAVKAIVKAAEERSAALEAAVEKVLAKAAESEARASEALAKAAASEAAATEALEKAAASEAALHDEREARGNEAAVLKAAAWTHIPGLDPNVVGVGLRELNKSNPALADEFVKMLDATDAAAASTDIFTEIGHENASAGDSAWERMNDLAKSMVINKSAANKSEALLAIASENEALYNEYLAEIGGR